METLLAKLCRFCSGKPYLATGYHSRELKVNCRNIACPIYKVKMSIGMWNMPVIDSKMVELEVVEKGDGG
jgi:hypothetical protein